MHWAGSFVGVAVAAILSAAPAAQAQDRLKLAQGGRGVGEAFVPELGQNAGIFKKHGIELDIFYTQGGGETIQIVISGAPTSAVRSAFSAPSAHSPRALPSASSARTSPAANNCSGMCAPIHRSSR